MVLLHLTNGVGRVIGAGVHQGNLVDQTASVFANVLPDPLALIAYVAVCCRGGFYIWVADCGSLTVGLVDAHADLIGRHNQG